MPLSLSMLTVENLRRFWSHRVIRNVAMLYLMQLGTYVLPLLVLPYLSRVLSPEKYGTIMFAQVFMYYFWMLSDYGFTLTATRQIAACRDDMPAVSRIFSNVMMARLFLMIIGFCIMIVVVLATPKMRMNWPLFLIAFLGVVGNTLFPQWLFQGLEKMEHMVFRDLTAKVLALICIFIFVHSDKDYLLAAGLQPGGMVVAGILSLFMVRRMTGVRFIWPAWGGVWGELKGSWPVFVSVAASTTCPSTNMFLLGLTAPPEMVAYYANGFRLIVAIRMLVSPLVTAIYPYVSNIAVSSSKNAVGFVQRYAFLLSAPFLAVSVILMAVAPLLVHVIFGPKYVYTGVLLQVMSPAPFLFAFSHCYCTYFMLVFGYDKQWSKLVLGSVVLNFAVLIPLMYSIQPTMALAVTGTVVDASIAVASYVFYRKHASEAASRTIADSGTAIADKVMAAE